MFEPLRSYLLEIIDNENWAVIVATAAVIAALVVIACIAHFVGRRGIVLAARYFAKKTAGKWDDILLAQKFFHRLAHIVPGLLVYVLGSAIAGRGTRCASGSADGRVYLHAVRRLLRLLFRY